MAEIDAAYNCGTRWKSCLNWDDSIERGEVGKLIDDTIRDNRERDRCLKR